MTDIVERLRVSVRKRELLSISDPDSVWIDTEREEAANEIVRLRAALTRIANHEELAEAQEPLGQEFEAVWDENIDSLLEGKDD